MAEQKITNYHLLVHLLNLHDQNLPPFKEARTKRINSTKKIISLINICARTQPTLPSLIFSLNPQDPEWDDDMVYPKIHYLSHFTKGVAGLGMMAFYAYNYPKISINLRLKTLRNLFPIALFIGFTSLYRSYTAELEKVRLFDEYVNIRAQELIEQNSYLLEHEDVKRYVWWSEDFKETLKRVHRQANNHDASDFKDSELLLQDFIRRYTDASKKYPLEREDGQVVLN